MIIVQSLIKIVKTVNCKQIDQVKKKKERKKEKNGTEQSRTTGLIGKRSEHIHTSTNTYIHIYAHITCGENRLCVFVCTYFSTYLLCTALIYHVEPG